MSEDREGDVDDVIEAVDRIMDVVRKNSDLLEGFVGGGVDSINVGDGEPLKKMFKDENKVEVVIDIGKNEPDKVEFDPQDDGVLIVAGGRKYKAITPSDVVLDDAEVELRNGVLTIEMPRSGDTGIEAEVIKNDEEIEKDKEDEE